MKLSALLQHIPYRGMGHSPIGVAWDIDITRVVELNDPTRDPHVMRWTNGALPKEQLSGALLTPAEVVGALAEVMIACDDPKASIIAAIMALYPKWHDAPCLITWNARTVHVGACTVIGGQGFGFHKGQRFPHIGGVRIGEGVEIGSNTCIDRGAIGDTVIGDNTKIDNLVHIAHNVRIGRDCHIVAGSVIGGSAVIGDRVFIGINASIRNKVRIGDDAIIGQGANVICDVPPAETWIGNPARKMEKG